MLTLFGNLDSGNVHKVQMILTYRGESYRRVDVRQDRGQPQDPRFRAVNEIGKVPAVRFSDGSVLSDSGALLYFFASGTPMWPEGLQDQAEVLRWMFFEQYSHEPALAVLRYLNRFATQVEVDPQRLADLVAKSRQALDILDKRLANSDWVAGPSVTIADCALYPYSRWMEEVDLPRRDWPAIDRWLDRFEQTPAFLPLYAEGAAEVVAFDDYFASRDGG